MSEIKSYLNDAKCSDEKWNKIFGKKTLQVETIIGKQTVPIREQMTPKGINGKVRTETEELKEVIEYMYESLEKK